MSMWQRITGRVCMAERKGKKALAKWPQVASLPRVRLLKPSGSPWDARIM